MARGYIHRRSPCCLSQPIPGKPFRTKFHRWKILLANALPGKCGVNLTGSMYLSLRWVEEREPLIGLLRSPEFDHRKRRAFGEPIHVAEYGIRQLGRRRFMMLSTRFWRRVEPKNWPSLFEDRRGVGMEHQNVSGLERDSPFVVGDILKNAQRKSVSSIFPQRPSFVQQWLRLPGVCDAQFLPALLPGGETCGHEPAFDAALPTS